MPPPDFLGVFRRSVLRVVDNKVGFSQKGPMPPLFLMDLQGARVRSCGPWPCTLQTCVWFMIGGVDHRHTPCLQAIAQRERRVVEIARRNLSAPECKGPLVQVVK